MTTRQMTMPPKTMFTMGMPSIPRRIAGNCSPMRMKTRPLSRLLDKGPDDVAVQARLAAPEGEPGVMPELQARGHNGQNPGNAKFSRHGR